MYINTFFNVTLFYRFYNTKQTENRGTLHVKGMLDVCWFGIHLLQLKYKYICICRIKLQSNLNLFSDFFLRILRKFPNLKTISVNFLIPYIISKTFLSVLWVVTVHSTCMKIWFWDTSMKYPNWALNAPVLLYSCFLNSYCTKHKV